MNPTENRNLYRNNSGSFDWHINRTVGDKMLGKLTFNYIEIEWIIIIITKLIHSKHNKHFTSDSSIYKKNLVFQYDFTIQTHPFDNVLLLILLLTTRIYNSLMNTF